MAEDLDRELTGLPEGLRRRTWMGRIEAVLFASATPVARADLARVVGQGVSVDLLVADLRADLEGRAVEIARVGDGWMMRTRTSYAPAIRAAADVGGQDPGLRAADLAVLAAVAYHQPVTRAELKDLFGREIDRDLIMRLRGRDLIAHGPRSPGRGAPRSYVTTPAFLATFDLETLADLPDPSEAG